MLDFLPYITPRADPSLSPMDFSVAVDDWNESLSKALKLNTRAFWSELLQNHTLVRFLNAFLGDYASFRGNKDDLWIMELQEVVRRVFVLYHRLSESMSGPDAMAASEEHYPDQETPDPGSALLDRGLISTSVLMDLANIYYTSDPDTVSKIVGSVLQHTPGLITDFRSSTNTVVQIIRKVQKKFERGGSGNGTGKGKGKGKGAAESAESSPEPSSPKMGHEKATEAMLYASALLDISFAIDAISASSPVLAIELHEHEEFLECLFGCYNYTLPVLTKLLIESEELGADVRSQPVLEFLRLRMLSIVANVLGGIYKQYMTDKESGLQSGEEQEAAEATLTDTLCEVIVSLYEQAPLLDHMRPMYDAPMVMDLEIQLDMSERLSKMIEGAFQGENDRISHWVVMLHELRDFNPATRGFIHDHVQRQSEKMARSLSGGFYGQEGGRSNSTISLDPNAPQIVVAPMSADQEEDYVKRTILISQLQDIFTDLGDGFLEACLLAFNDDPETVTMKLLEEDLPSELATLDRNKARYLSGERPKEWNQIDSLHVPCLLSRLSLLYNRSPPHRVESAPTSMAVVKASDTVQAEDQDVLATRRNIFDGDEFDMFSGNVVDKSKMSRGKRGYGSLAQEGCTGVRVGVVILTPHDSLIYCHLLDSKMPMLYLMTNRS